ncbi:MAG: hypothetical protein Q8M98_02835 [Candidatus Cloacimonadaceae bacterium]|nr:hypothetical protein [Candidatus Cloacimonadaceae bacterium]
MIKEDRDRAIEEYIVHFADLNKLGSEDVLYLVGHFYAVADDAKTAIPYFKELSEDPRLGEDARRMLNLLLYQRAAHYLLNEKQSDAQDFLQDILNLFDTGKYYPTYLYLWADIIAETERHQEVLRFVGNFGTNKDWIDNQFKPRKAAIIARINAIDFDGYYADPTQDKGQAIETRLNDIQSDLKALYTEAESVQGLIMMDSLEKMQAEEMAILDELKKQIKAFREIPAVDLEALAKYDISDERVHVYAQYREGAMLLQQLKFTVDYYDLIIRLIDAVFENQYQLFVKEDPSILGKDFSDMEMKRLFDIERNLYIYEQIIASIAEIKASPDYKKLNVDLDPQLKEYTEKYQDLQIRKARYLSLRTYEHETDVERMFFEELLQEYYAITRDRLDLQEILPEIESAMISLIMLRYPEEIQKNIETQKILAANDSSRNIELDNNFDSLLSNLDFLSMQVEYRHLRYRDQQRVAAQETEDYAKLEEMYLGLIADKKALLVRHQKFEAENPDFMALEQPSGGYLIGKANLYYNMAELQFAVDLQHPEKALAYYRQTLEADPAFYLRDYALYNIAYISSELKKEELVGSISDFRELNPRATRSAKLKFTEESFREALNAFEEIVRGYKTSPYYDESVFRLGVLSFLIGTDATSPIEYYARSNRYFDELIAKPDSKYKYEALYQRGWVRMNIGDEESLRAALGDFAMLLKDVNAGKIQNKIMAEDLKTYATGNMAYCLVALDGLDFNSVSKGALAFSELLADYDDERVFITILDKAAMNKKEMAAPLQAIDFMELRLRKAPNSLQNPALVDSIIVLYHTPGLQQRSGETLTVLRTKNYHDIVANYNPQTRWYEVNIKDKNVSDPVVRKQLASIRNAYEELRIRHYNAVYTDFSTANYDAYTKHIQEYAKYNEIFDGDYDTWTVEMDKSDVQLVSYLAEKRNTPLDYLLAYDKLIVYNQKYSADQDIFKNEGLAYKYAQNLFTAMSAEFEKPGYTPLAPLPTDQNSLFAFFSTATLRFYDVLNSDAYASETNRLDAVQILMSLADIEMKRGMTGQARTHFAKLIEFEDRLNSVSKRSIYISMATLEEENKSFAEAEQWYRKALPHASNAQDRELINDLIKLQIQNSYELAQKNGDFNTVAVEFLRLANEFKTDPVKYSEYVYRASEAYVQAKNFERAVELRMEVAGMKTDMEEVYALYFQSWTIAETELKDVNKAKELKMAFVGKYPASNRAFALKVEEIEALKKVPGQSENAAQMFLTLHQDVKAKRIDSGMTTSEGIYLWAVDVYRQDSDKPKMLNLLSDFIVQYPNHTDALLYKSVLADEYLALGDTLRFEQHSREIFLKDKTKPERYLSIAYRNLGKIAYEFDTAYLNQDWTLAFAKRDEFKRVEASYVREGLKMDNVIAHAAFIRAEADHKEAQARQAYLRSVDTQLNAIANGQFLKSTPNQLIAVSDKTTWQKNLFGGKLNKIPSIKPSVEAEYNKLIRILKTPDADKWMDTQRRVRALTLIARINEFAASAIKTQVNRYLAISNEFKPFKTKADYQSILDNNIWPQANEHINPYLAYAYSIHMQIYRDFYIAGYSDANTSHTISQLTGWNALPDYQVDEFILGSGWSMQMINRDGASSAINSGITFTTSPKGQKLGTMTIPALNTLVIERGFNAKIEPEFVYIQMVYPYDLEVFVNGKKADLGYVAVDTLVAGKAITTRNAIKLGATYWLKGANTIRCTFPNAASENIPFHFNLLANYNKEKLAEATPVETVKHVSTDRWKVITLDSGSNQEIATYAKVADRFNIPLSAINNMSATTAMPIWAQENPDQPLSNVVFEYDFNIDTLFREGYIEFVAPETASVYLNGNVLDEDYPMDYDAEPFQVYPNRISIPKNMIKQGRNTLRLTVQNQSAYRGMIAEISITKTVKE